MAGVVNERSEQRSSGRSFARGDPARTRAAGDVEVWGILNVTPDSFSDGGAHFGVSEALAHAMRMLAEGADVIDVGGASSRPKGTTYGAGAATVSLEEELRRTVPVIEAIARAAPRATVSIDTTSAEVAAAALMAGARIVNDVSMGRSETLLEVCAAHDAELVLMHTREDGRIDATTSRYDDLVADVIAELEVALARARARGVARERLWIDPGLGFAKTAPQSMQLLAATERLAQTGWPVLVGASRKSFLGVHAGMDTAPPALERLGASVAAASLAAHGGARAVRVHDVRETRQAVSVARHARALRSATPTTREVGP